jgi:SAM-dependent methyltransferase
MTGEGGVAPQGLSAWFDTPPGRYLLDWERQRFDVAVADLFGYHAVQLGLPEIDALRTNRMSHRWQALPEVVDVQGVPSADPHPRRGDLVTHAAALPFAASSIDLMVLPHTLEFSADARTVLREVERVLVPQGRVVITGLNPASLWGLRQQRLGLGRFDRAWVEGDRFLPQAGDLVSPWRLRDWLHLLGLEVESQTTGCYRPAARTDQWLQRFAWLDCVGPRCWPALGAVYFMVAVKRVRGMHLLGPAWKPRRAAALPVAVARKNDLHRP